MAFLPAPYTAEWLVAQATTPIGQAAIASALIAAALARLFLIGRI